MVFVDGQNLYKRCQEFFGHPLCHPHLLAEVLVGDRNLVGTRFYTGIPDRNVSDFENRKLRFAQRRIGAMRSCGVTVLTRELKYNWDWGFDAETRLRMGVSGPERADIEVWAQPYQRAREKGIDMAIGLEVVEFALKGQLDVAIIVSHDTDLHEIPQSIKEIKDYLPWPIRVEAATPVHPDRKNPMRFRAFDFTHQITKDLFDPIRDNTDYTVGPDEWVKPVDLPKHLNDLA